MDRTVATGTARRHAILLAAGLILAGVALEGTAFAAGPTLPGMPQAGSAQSDVPVISADGGAATFADKCSGCHGSDANGAHGPALRGEQFWSQWEGKPLRKLYSRIISTMPQDDAGTLSEEETLGLVAFLTRLNTGSAPNPPYASANDLNTVIVAATKAPTSN